MMIAPMSGFISAVPVSKALCQIAGTVPIAHPSFNSVALQRNTESLMVDAKAFDEDLHTQFLDLLCILLCILRLIMGRTSIIYCTHKPRIR